MSELIISNTDNKVNGTHPVSVRVRCLPSKEDISMSFATTTLHVVAKLTGQRPIAPFD